ncbi:hypothetical protein [Microbulbifer sp. MCCC 1A16149]|uniref:hypothetical protein n=1 Tax=Microbulbifer sp. MCCC 1A16149 TaxID=3411322 RepID=UPI003D0D9197
MKISREDVATILELTREGYNEHFDEFPEAITLEEFAYSLGGTVAQTFYSGALSPREAHIAHEKFCEMLVAGTERWIQRNRPGKVLN